MKVLHIIAVVLLCSGIAFAATPTEKTTTAKDAPKLISGTVVSIDTVDKTVTVMAGKVNDTLSVTDSTKIKVGGKKAKIGHLTADMKVLFSFKKEGSKNIAVKISEKIAPKEKGTEKKAGHAVKSDTIKSK